MVRNWWKISAHPAAPTSPWVRWSIWKSWFVRSSTRINRRVHDSESLEWSVSFDHDIRLFGGNTAKAVVTTVRTADEGRSGPVLQQNPPIFKPCFETLRIIL